MASEYSDDGTELDHPAVLGMDALLAPFRALVSKSAMRLYLNTLLFIGVSLLLIGVSVVAYTIFYLRFIPAVGLERVVHLQFGDGHPWGTASFNSEFVSLQPYDVSVTLELPRTPSNLDTGNFMIDLTLYSRPGSALLPGSAKDANPIMQSRRSAILTYTSPLVDVARRMARLPLYVVGWRREAEILDVSMLEQVEFARGSRNLPESLRLEIQSDDKMQVYSARVQFRARFTGMRWFMYRWKLTSFAIFSSVFWMLSMASASLTWLLLNTVLQSEPTPAKTIKDEDHNNIKDAPEDSPTSPGPDIKEEREESALLQSFLSDDPGVGSGLESAQARGVQRRRSNLKDEPE